MKPRAEQIPLSLGHRPALGRADFLISAANRDAAAMVFNWRDWPERRLALAGPESSGKSHLAALWAVESGAVLVRADALAPEAAPGLAAAGAVAVEACDTICRIGDPARRRVAEDGFFHLYNLLNAEGGYLLATARLPPAEWGFETRDPASRAGSLPVARIASPDDALLSSVLVKLFADRQLEVAPDVVAFLTARIDRSFAAAEAVVEALDRLSLARRRRVTRSLAAEALERTG